MSTVLLDLRFASRSLARNPGATALIVLTLTLGVAANVAVFSLVDGLFLRPFALPHPERLVYLDETAPRWNLEFTGINYPDFARWRRETRAFEGMAVQSDGSANLTDGSVAERVVVERVTHDYLAVLGVRPLLGRAFTPEEDRPGGAAVVMLGEGMWRTRFGGASDVVGRTLRINSVPHTVIGVAPARAELVAETQLWLPLAENPDATGQAYSYSGVARLRPGVTLEQARADLARAHQAIWQRDDTGHVVSPRILPLRDRFVADYRAIGGALGASVALVLLIACANVASVMLARAIFRRRELGIRLALGATGGRLGRLLLTESLVIAAAASALGTLLGYGGLQLLLASLPDRFPRWAQFAPDLRVALFALAVTALTAALFGGLPALQAMRLDVRGLIGSAGRASASVPQRRMLNALVIAEVALATILLVGSGLLLREYRHLRTLDPGFRADHVLTFRVWLSPARYPGGLAERAFFEEMVGRLGAIPGVRRAAAISCPPLDCHWGRFLEAEGVARAADGSDPVTLFRVATPGYFDAMGITVLRGRVFDETDGREGGPRSVIVNEEFARRTWPDVDDPVGKRVRGRGDTSAADWRTVVGVVKDARHYGLTTPMRPGIFLPVAEMREGSPVGTLAFVLHTSVEPTAVIPAARAIVRARDPELPIAQVRTMAQALDRSLALGRTLVAALAFFSAVALALAVAGIYGVLSYVVGRRTPEIGIRLALGAGRAQVLGLVVRQGLGLVAVGLALGIPAALAASRVLGSLLTGVSSRDPATYLLVAALLALTGTAAALVPARRAAGTDVRRAIAEE